MDIASIIAIDKLLEDIASTHDEIMRIEHPRSTSEIRRALTQRGLHRVRVVRHVIYPQLGLEYVVYREPRSKQLRIVVL